MGLLLLPPLLLAMPGWLRAAPGHTQPLASVRHPAGPNCTAAEVCKVQGAGGCRRLVQRCRVWAAPTPPAPRPAAAEVSEVQSAVAALRQQLLALQANSDPGMAKIAALNLAEARQALQQARGFLLS